jgi:hypothetical protein
LLKYKENIMEIVIVGCPPVIVQKPKNRPEDAAGIPNPNLPKSLFKKIEPPESNNCCGKNLDTLG